MRQAVGARGGPRIGIAAVLAGSALLALLGACAMFDKAKSAVVGTAVPAAVQAVVKAPGQKAVTVTTGQAGAGVELGLGQELVVRLGTVVVSGREWSLVDLAPGVLVAAGPVFERDLRNADAGEAIGASVWRLRPVAAGVVTLRFEYRRPRNVEPASEVVTYAVTVR